MGLNVYIYFNGNCRDAVDFYSAAFNVPKQKIMTFGEAPQNPQYPLPEEAKNRIIHTFLNINGSMIMFSDIFLGTPYNVGSNISLAYMSKNLEEIKAIFNKLKDGGSVNMEMQETFFSKCFGTVTDKFGVLWQIGYENEH